MPAADRRRSATTASAPAPAATEEDAARSAAIADRLRPPTSEWQDGLAAVVLVDVSGSMADRVRDANGERRRKIVIAQRAALDLVRVVRDLRPRRIRTKPVSVGIFEFSERDGQPAARVVVPPGPPDARRRTRAYRRHEGQAAARPSARR